MSTDPAGSRQRGVTLIELIVFIVIVGIAIGGVLSILTQAVRTSADPMVQKQALAIAEALLEEIELQPFTFCDPDDANASTATGTGGCATTVETAAQHTADGESRYSAANPFDNVIDYGGFAMSAGILDITGTALSGLGSYTATVAVANDASLGAIANSEVLRITVTVTGPGNTSVVLDGYRTRFAPRT